MSPDLLSAIGEALFGPFWQVELANTLGINRRTIRRWLNSEFAVPDAITDSLLALCKNRNVEILHLIKETEIEIAKRPRPAA